MTVLQFTISVMLFAGGSGEDSEETNGHATPKYCQLYVILARQGLQPR